MRNWRGTSFHKLGQRKSLERRVLRSSVAGARFDELTGAAIAVKVIPDVDTPKDSYPQLLSLAVHEFRTPASVVGGYLRMLQRDTRLDVERSATEDDR